MNDLTTTTRQITLRSRDEMYWLSIAGAHGDDRIGLGVTIDGTEVGPQLGTIIQLADLLAVIADQLDVQFPGTELNPVTAPEGRFRSLILPAQRPTMPNVAIDTRVQGPSTMFSDRGNPIVVPTNHPVSVSFGLCDLDPDGWMQHTVMAVSAHQFLNAITDLFGITWIDAGGYVTRHMSDPLPPFEVFPDRTTADWVDDDGRQLRA